MDGHMKQPNQPISDRTGLTTRQQIILLVVIGVMVALGFAATKIIRSQQVQIDSLKDQSTRLEIGLDHSKKARDEAQRTLTNLQDQLSQASPREPVVPSKDIWMNVSSSTVDLLKTFLPFKPEEVREAIELTPGVVAVDVESKQEPSSVYRSIWFVNANTKELKLIQEPLEVNLDNDRRLLKWSQGFIVETFMSPGEAVISTYNEYYDRSGRFIASSLSGDFDRDGASAEITFGKKKILVELEQQGCANPEQLHELNTPTPTTTLLALRLNEKRVPFPHPVVVRCEWGYGDSLGPFGLRHVSFDGTQFTLDVDGFAANIGSDGRVVYVPTKPYYKDVWAIKTDAYRSEVNSLYRVDEYGEHLVLDDIRKDPVIEKLITLRQVDMQRETETADIVKYKLFDFEDPYYRTSIGAIVFDKTKKSFRDLELVNP
jgi:hypothetical protein